MRDRLLAHCRDIGQTSRHTGEITRSYLVIGDRCAGRLACLMVIAAALLLCVLPRVAVAERPLSAPNPASGPKLGYSLTPSKTEPYAVCPPATKGRVECMSIAVPTPAARAQARAEWLLGLGPEPPAEPSYEGTGRLEGFSPSELREAYGIHETGGSGQTVAIVDPYDDPNAEADLKVYRKEYKLSECTKANGCFKKVNQEGKEEKYPTSKYPINEKTGKVENWGLEISLDVDMVSAICPECKILLVEANDNSTSNMYAAEDEAAKWEEATTKKKSTEISNSWGEPEYSEETSANTHFNHEGIPITVAAGDHGYGVSYPAASKYVISVGGTELYKEKTEKNPRGWIEKQWTSTGATGSGCSAYEKKPKWQEDLGCENRTDNDTAAVAGPATPVSLYDSYETEGCTAERREKDLCWQLEGGTSAAAPIVAGVEAHASEAVKKEPNAEAFYRHRLYAVTSGGQGGCHNYLCIAEPGYNGPAGWGAPDGPLELAAGYHAITDAATAVTSYSATLNGYVNPEGVETEYRFEYGKTTAYEDGKTPAKVGTGVLWKAASQSLTGLELNTTYHYRLVASNKTSGTIYGEDRTIVTSGFAEETLPKNGESEEREAYGVSCKSQVCIAVGSYLNVSAKALVPLAEIWNGSSWSVQSTPSPSGAKESYLESVSCVSSTECTAVGSYENSSSTYVTLAEHWNGKEWSIQETKTPTGAKSSSLSGISCASSEACTAVGRYVNSSSVEAPLAERWNGKEWLIQETKTPAEATASSLGGVSCTSSTECTAVGYYKNSSSTDETLAERWNGTAWSIQPTPNPASGKEGPNNEGNRLFGVSCTSSTACTAVGSYFIVTGKPSKNSGTEYTVAEKWNGTEWSVQTTINPGGTENNEQNGLLGISCTSSTACTAVGYYQQGAGVGNLEVLGERWNGTTWTVVGVPGPSQPLHSWRESYLDAVSCTEATVCTAVGNNLGALLGELAPRVGFAEREFMPSATTEAATGVTEFEATLNGSVNPAGIETKYYFEYGETMSYGKRTAEASAGSGTISVKESQAITGLTAGTLYHFRIVASNSMKTTYGEDRTFTTAMPSWRITSTPNPNETSNSYLFGVSCTSSSACSAMGEYGSGSTAKPLAERWNGTEWSLQTVPNPTGAKTTHIRGVSCTSSTACTASGYYQNTSGIYLSLTESWNGTEWKILSTTEPTGTLNSLLVGVSCTAFNACTAVGWYENSSGVELPWAARWNGTAWSVQTVPSPTGAKGTFPYDVSCTSSTACTMAGYYENTSGTWTPFAESWNGTEWTVQSVPNPTGSTRALLTGASCTSSAACTVSGYYENSSGTALTLAERWNGTEWKVQSTLNPEGAKDSYLNGGVSCTSSTACTAVGDYLNSSSKFVTLAERWNGTEWKIQSTPNDEKGEGWLSGGVSCASLTSCAAVGNTGKTFAEIYG